MKFFLLFFLFLIPAFSKPSIKIGALAYKKFVVIKDGKAHGIFADHIEKHLSEKYNLLWEDIPLNRAIFSLQNDIIDLYGGILPTEERRKSIDFSDTPIIQTYPQICTLTKKLNGASHFKLEDVKGKTLAYPAGATVLPQIKKLEAKLVTVTYTENFVERLIKLLESSRTEFIHLPEIRSTKPYIENKTLTCISSPGAIEVFLAFKKGSPWKQILKDLNIPPVRF